MAATPSRAAGGGPRKCRPGCRPWRWCRSRRRCRAGGRAPRAASDPLGGRGDRRVVERRRALVPRRHQPLGGGRGGQGRADDEAEVTRAVGHGRGGRAEFVEHPQRRRRIVAADRQGLVEGREGAEGLGVREDAAMVHAREIDVRAAVGLFDQGPFVHGLSHHRREGASTRIPSAARRAGSAGPATVPGGCLNHPAASGAVGSSRTLRTVNMPPMSM